MTDDEDEQQGEPSKLFNPTIIETADDTDEQYRGTGTAWKY
ncbi:hypothetical protein [Amycolatopsis nigrescens]|nr:hypothetical protein [Amycolatopsis nigrescens]